MTKFEDNLEAVFHYLMDNASAEEPLEVDWCGQIGAEIGIEPTDVYQVFQHVRSPEWIRENKWTIPFVARGRGVKLLFVYDTEEDTPAAKRGLLVHARETVTRLGRERAQFEMMYELIPNKRTREAKLVRGLLARSETMEDDARKLVEMLVATINSDSDE